MTREEYDFIASALKRIETKAYDRYAKYKEKVNEIDKSVDKSNKGWRLFNIMQLIFMAYVLIKLW